MKKNNEPHESFGTKTEKKITMSHIFGYFSSSSANQPINQPTTVKHTIAKCQECGAFLLLSNAFKPPEHQHHFKIINCVKQYSSVKCLKIPSEWFCVMCFFPLPRFYFDHHPQKYQLLLLLYTIIMCKHARVLEQILMLFPHHFLLVVVVVVDVIVALVAVTQILRLFNRINTRHKNSHTIWIPTKYQPFDFKYEKAQNIANHSYATQRTKRNPIFASLAFSRYSAESL